MNATTKTVKTYSEHVRQDSKLLWAGIALLGYLSGSLTDIATLFYPVFDDRYLTIEQFEKEKCNCIESAANPAIISPNSNGQVPRIVNENNET